MEGLRRKGGRTGNYKGGNEKSMADSWTDKKEEAGSVLFFVVALRRVGVEKREGEFGLVRNEMSCGSLGSIEECESSVLYFLTLRAWLLIEFCLMRQCLAK